jgi:periplasmic protein TonB
MPSPPPTTEQPSRTNGPRHAARKRIDTLVYADLGPDNGGFPINVSEAGMAFQGIQPIEKDQVVPIKFKLPGINNSVNAMGQVVWLNESRKGGGLRFIDLPDNDRLVINDWLSLPTQTASLNQRPAVTATQVETKESKLAPAIPPAANRSETPARTVRNVVTPVAPPTPPPVTADEVTPPKVTPKSTVNSLPSPLLELVDLLRIPEPPALVEDKPKRREWITPFEWGLFTSFAVMTILGMIVWQIHGGLPLHTSNGTSVEPVSQSQAAPVSSPSAAKNASIQSRKEQTVLAASPLDAQSKPGIMPQPTQSSAAKLVRHTRPSETPVAPPKVNSDQTLPQQLTATAKPVASAPTVPPQPADFVPPATAPQPKPAPTPQPSVTQPALPAPIQTSSIFPSQQSTKIEEAQVITRRSPVYPQMAKAAGVSGSVELHFTIGLDGVVRDISVVTGNHLLANAAIDALQGWRYRPARRDGVPFATETNAIFVFRPN